MKWEKLEESEEAGVVGDRGQEVEAGDTGDDVALVGGVGTCTGELVGGVSLVGEMRKEVGGRKESS